LQYQYRVEYRKACRAANKAIMESRSTYYSGRIQEANTDVQRLWTDIRDVQRLDRYQSRPTPDSCTRAYICHWRQ